MVPTPEETIKSEHYRSYVTGWTDGAKGAAKQVKFTEHETRPDLAQWYERGHDSGRSAKNEALKRASAMTGYVPSVLR